MIDEMTSTFESRRGQAFPTLNAREIDRLRRFGAVRRWADGECLFEAGVEGPGMIVVLSGIVTVTRRDGLGGHVHVYDQGAGEFLGEVGQLTGRPAFVDGHAGGPVEALLIAPDSLRSLVVAEAELGEKIMRALILRRVILIEEGIGAIVVGMRDASDTVRLAGFLTRNGHPFRVVEPGTQDTACSLIQHCTASANDLPLVLCPNGEVLKNPDESALARCLGMVDPARIVGRSFDVAVVGAGPAGLAAAVYAASEGLSVVVLDTRAFGGQAGASARIENLLGFPTGITGQALSGRAFVQAQKFGAEMAIPMAVSRLDCSAVDDGRLRLELGDAGALEAKTVVLASGARYRRLEVEGQERFDGRGVSYWATPLEARQVKGEEVLLVGGGNSAGQAAVFLAEHAKRVRILVRRPLRETMSQYLVERIAGAPTIEVIERAQVTSLAGEYALEQVRWKTPDGQFDESIRFLFLFIGAEPATGWLADCGVALERGFVMTGQSLPRELLGDSKYWRTRSPAPHETSVPGVFAIGDVRAGSVKRVGAAIGEGAAVVAQIHAHLAAE
jgi:thioredoxin reductase (NADPH)